MHTILIYKKNAYGAPEEAHYFTAPDKRRAKRYARKALGYVQVTDYTWHDIHRAILLNSPYLAEIINPEGECVSITYPERAWVPSVGQLGYW